MTDTPAPSPLVPTASPVPADQVAIPADGELGDGFVRACDSCALYAGRGFCAAFYKGDGIPREILMGHNPHDIPVEGDGGIIYERAPWIEAPA